MQWPKDLAEDSDHPESDGRNEGSRPRRRRGSSSTSPTPRLKRAPSSRDDPAWNGYWDSFVAHFGADLRRFAGASFRRYGIRANVEDLVDETFDSFILSLMEKGTLDRVDVIRHPKAYLRTLLTGHMSDAYQRRRAVKRGGRYRRDGHDVGCLASPGTTPADGDDAATWLVPALNGAIQQLERRNRGYASLLRHLQVSGSRGRAELAARFDLTPNALTLRLHRARRALLTELLKAVRSVTPDLETAKARCRWLARGCLPLRSARTLGLR